jgi:hypothetical protein
MIFGLKNASATYQRTMNLIFYDLIGVIMEVNIDDIVIESAAIRLIWPICVLLLRGCASMI